MGGGGGLEGEDGVGDSGNGVVERGGCTIFCPPGPLPLTKNSSISDSGGGLGRVGICLALGLGEVVKVAVGVGGVWMGRRVVGKALWKSRGQGMARRRVGRGRIMAAVGVVGSQGMSSSPSLWSS